MAYTADSPILGAPRGTAAQLRAFLTRRAVGYTPYDVAVIVDAYRVQGAAVGVDWFLALAQLAHETGALSEWWAQRPRRNPAGIGVTGAVSATRPARGVWQWRESTRRWEEGLAFSSWADHAVPAHLGRLLAYALRDADAHGAQRALIARALAYRPLPDRYRGCAPTLRGLGGTWAVPGTTYADKIAAIATAVAQI